MGLTGLIANGWLNETGIPARQLKEVTRHPGNALSAWKVISYRTAGPNGRGRVAVKMKLFNPPGRPSWTPAGAALVGPKHEVQPGLMVWPLDPIPPETSGSITVEMEAEASEARGTFRLKLWADEAGAGGVTLDGVTFPDVHT